MTTSDKGHIFISYRRADSAPWAGRIYDRLTAHFGKDAIFMDVDTIEAGVDFVEVLQNAVQSCDVLVALIGRQWLSMKDADGKRRLDNPEDFVRIEVATALERDIRVIPVLVDGVSMPRSTDLPENLKLLSRRNALQVDHHTFNSDARRLISQLELALSAAEESRILKARKLEAEKVRREKEAAEKARLEKEERKRKEVEEKARKEKEAREKAETEERIRLAAEQKAKKESGERERREAKEKARKAALRKARKGEIAERIKNVFSSGRKTPFFIGGGIIIIFLLGYIINSALAPSALSSSIEATPTSKVIPTNIPPTPTPTLGVGSTKISEKDGMVMVYVPAGEFQMGSDADDALAECQKFRTVCERDWFTNQEPIHTVNLNAFWIDQTEVTNGMFAVFLNDEGNQREVGTTWLNADNEDVRIHKIGGNWQADSGYGYHPVIGVSWYGAKAYCEWTGRRLPTEAEWEKAAGWDEDAQAKRTFPWGDTIDESYANYIDENGLNVMDTTAVKNYEKGASFFGAYDMTGNVWEWVSDWYGSDYYASSPTSNPPGPDSGSFRVKRGGSWASYGGLLTSERGEDDPSNPFNLMGFRCALSTASGPTDIAEPKPEPTEEPPEELGVGSTNISEKDGMALMYVPDGEFQMGSDVDDALAECQKYREDCQHGWFTDEEPIHSVYLDAFWIDQTEVTNKMFAGFLSAEGNQSEGSVPWLFSGYLLEEDISKKGDIWQASPGYENHPVRHVSWYGAKAYCDWAGRRLPTEAEWEKAARGGFEGKAYPWGDEPPVCDRGAKNGAQYLGCDNQTVPVGSFSQNGYGLYDMSGNVWEWVSSLYETYPYNVSDGREDPSANGFRVLRGGAAGSDGYLLLLAERYEYDPTNNIAPFGFRCARDATP